MRTAFLVSLILMTCCIAARVQAEDSQLTGHNHAVSDLTRAINFIKNEGQWDHPGRFRADIPGGVLFLSDKGFVYNFTSSDDLNKVHELTCGEHQEAVSDIVLHHHAYFVNFVGAHLSPEYSASEKRSQYHNYFIGNDRSTWKGGVGLYGEVTQKAIYKGIDLSVYSKGQSVKYDFIIAPGADPNQIRLEFEGVEPYLNEHGDLVIKTTVNEVIERAPYTYQVIDGREVEVPSAYVLKDGVLSFVFPEGYQEAYPLIVDPDLVFATYSTAASGGYYSYSTTYDDEGNLYAGAAATSGASGWPVTAGAFQSTNNGGTWEVAINKYNEIGTAIIYSTYYGGNGQDYPNAMMVNALGELIVVGNTSSSNLPFTTGCIDSTLGGTRDIFVAHFNATGTDLIGATYMGGSDMEPEAVLMDGSTGDISAQNLTSPVELTIDSGGNIWVVANTKSSDFPVTMNACQSTLSGGYDAVVFQLDPTCSELLYSTYLGGTGIEAGFSIVLDPAGNVVVGGSTTSTDFPTTGGVLHTTAPGGDCDGFVSIINTGNGALMNSSYIGTHAIDQVVNLQMDHSGDIFLLGRTRGSYPVSPGVYSMPDADVLIDRVHGDLSSSVLSTRLGIAQTSNRRFFPTSFLLDRCGNIYLSGMVESSPGMPLTPDAFSTAPDDFWFIVLEPHFSDILFGSYYGSPGGDHSHVGVTRMDPNGVVYQSVCSNSAAFPTTPGVVGPDKLNGPITQDIISFKVDFQFAGVQAKISLDVGQNDSICAPGTVAFKNASTSSHSITYAWDFGDGNTSTAVDPNHTYTIPGMYDVVLHARSDSACVTDSWDTFRITVLYAELPDIVTEGLLVCSDEDAVNLSVLINNPGPNTSIHWGPSSGLLSGADSDTVTVDPGVNTLYYVTVKDTIPGVCGLSTTDTVVIDFMPRALEILTDDTTVCQGSMVQVLAQSLPGYSFHWAPSTGVSDTTALNPVISVNASETYTVTASYPGCPDTAQILSIEMQAYPLVDLGPDKEICQWQEISLESSVTPFRNDYTYSWTPADGLSMPDGPNVEYIADTSGSYALVVSTPIGCIGSDTLNVLVHPGGFGDIIADTGFCPSGSVPLWASGGTEYRWEPAYGLDDSSAARPLASPNSTTAYTVYIMDAHNCVDTERVVVEVFPAAVINLPDSITVFPGESYHLQPGTNAYYFNWFPTNGINSTTISDPVFNPAVRTRYFVTATTEQGCFVTDSLDVVVEGTVIDIPNAFVPGKGANPVFKPSKRGIAQLQEFSIFNRWGNKVFSTTDIDAGWDGTYNGAPQPMGVYIYQVRAVLDSGQVFSQQGDVTLIR